MLSRKGGCQTRPKSSTCFKWLEVRREVFLPCSETGYRVLGQGATVFWDKFYRALKQELPCSETSCSVF